MDATTWVLVLQLLLGSNSAGPSQAVIPGYQSLDLCQQAVVEYKNQSASNSNTVGHGRRAFCISGPRKEQR